MMSQRKERSMVASVLYLLILVFTGCASPTYQYGLPNRPMTNRIQSVSNQVTFGGEHPKLDRAERWIHYPARKFKQWFPDKEPTPDPEQMRSAAILKAQEYLVLNGLTDVKIDVRQYDPKTQWNRLRENNSIHPFWKYTGGSLSHLSYTLLPGRIFRADNFNPYTNTLSLNSSDPSMALYAAAEAKIVFNRPYPGTYLAACNFPILGISKTVNVANDVLSYARVRREWDLERDLTRQIYTNFGSDLVIQTLPLVPGSHDFPFYYAPALTIAGSTAGDVAGHAVLHKRTKEQQAIAPITQGTPQPTPSVEP